MRARWWWCAVRYVPFLILAMLVAPVLPAFASNHYGRLNNGQGYGREPRLPGWLAWFMTPDNSLLGDDGFKAAHDGSYWSQVLWLWRNPAYGLACGPLRHNRLLCDAGVRTVEPDGYWIRFADGSWEHTYTSHGFKKRTGWLVGGLSGMFLLSIRRRK